MRPLLACLGLVVLSLSGCLESDGPARAAGVQVRLFGENLAPYPRGESPENGDEVSQEQVRLRMAEVAVTADWVKTFGTEGGLARANVLAQEFGLRIAMGPWISRSSTRNDAEIARWLEASMLAPIDVHVIGSEAVFRRDQTVPQTRDRIEALRALLPPGAVMTTAEDIGVWINQPSLADATDIVLANIYPYWSGVRIEDAVAELDHQYRLLQGILERTNRSQPIWIGETGWPSAGSDQLRAEPSVNNHARYFREFVQWARHKGVPYFYFSSHDEDWKQPIEPNEVGGHWGIRREDGDFKSGNDIALRDVPAVDTWTRTPICSDGGAPRVELTYVPPIGSFDWVEGRVCNVDPSQYAVVLYIYVGSRWWVKPYSDRRITFTDVRGSFRIDYTTGGIDQQATKMRAYLVHSEYRPPFSPNAALAAAAAHWVEVQR